MPNPNEHLDTNRLNRELLIIAENIQGLINLEYERVNWEPEPESALDQAGLRNGFDVVKDYVEHGEAGIAFDHLLYMIKETRVQLSEDSWTCLLNIASKLGVSLTSLQTTHRNEV